MRNRNRCVPCLAACASVLFVFAARSQVADAPDGNVAGNPANYAKYGDHVDQFPVDAHMLIALIAPRPVLLQTGDTDRWSDPKGEFLAAAAAGPVYRLLGKRGLNTDQMPQAGQAVGHTLRYFMHAGGHGSLPSDWGQFLSFMQLHLQPDSFSRD